MPTKPPARCPQCKRKWQGTGRCPRCRGTTTQRGYGTQWKRMSAAVVQAWREQQGDWCPGYQVPAHPATDLTTDHAQAMAAGGTRSPSLEDVAVLCRACNSRKHDH